MDIQDHSDKKRWVGFKTDDMQQSATALLVHWNVDPIGDKKEAFIYATGERMVGSVSDLLRFLNERAIANHVALTGKQPPEAIAWGNNPTECKGFDFFTQAWRGETKARTTQNVIFTNPHDNATYWQNYAKGVSKWQKKQLSRPKGNRLALLASAEKAA